MCFEPDSRPPIAAMAGAAVDGAGIILTAEDGGRLRAFRADASRPSGAAVVILPDVRGLHRYYEELALRFAEAGVDAVAVDYFGRTAGVEPRPDDFDHMAHVGRTRYAELLADTRAAVVDVRGGRDVRAVFTIGFCFGGRLAFLTATRPELELAGAIGFYGVPVGAGRNDMPAPLDVADQTACPVLGLFGGADASIPPDAIGAYDAVLTAAGVDHVFVTYPEAPHSFFDRKAAEFADASADAWASVLDFIRTHTPST